MTVGGLRYTLLAEGPTDRPLLPILDWLLEWNGVTEAIQPQWADLRHSPRPPQSLAERMIYAVDLYPCDLLFVHRDADREPRTTRIEEILEAEHEARAWNHLPPVVSVVPVRAMEAWLLINEQAVREAADNPNGRDPLVLPPLRELERIEPKHRLDVLLKQASHRSGRRLMNFRTGERVIRISRLIDDFAPLLSLSAFAALDASLRQCLQIHGWTS